MDELKQLLKYCTINKISREIKIGIYVNKNNVNNIVCELPRIVSNDIIYSISSDVFSMYIKLYFFISDDICIKHLISLKKIFMGQCKIENIRMLNLVCSIGFLVDNINYIKKVYNKSNEVIRILTDVSTPEQFSSYKFLKSDKDIANMPVLRNTIIMHPNYRINGIDVCIYDSSYRGLI